MFPVTLSRVQRESLQSLGRAALAMVLIGGLSILSLPTLAQAADNGTPATYNVAATFPGTNSNPTTEQQVPAPRWTLLSDNFAQTSTPEAANVPESAFATATPAPVAFNAMAYPAPALAMNANGDSSGGGHGHWLLPVIAGGLILGAGLAITIKAHDANCSNINNSEAQSICGGIKTGGLVAIPVGAALVGLGVFLRLR
jgi:hypothetical protein